jgi:DNA-binding transcriptional regulator YiaG
MLAPDLLLIRSEGAALQARREDRDMADEMKELVRELRRELKMTQEEFAHELGITVGTVNRWENGRFKPSKLARATLADFAHRHGVSLDRLLHRSGNQQYATTQ